MKDVPDHRHPNSPLVEVAFELRFSGETAIECKRHKIQDRLRSSYPNLLVPKIQSGMAYALEPYRFETSDANAGVMVSLNKFGYYCKTYPGYETFKDECLRLCEFFGTIVHVEKLNRIGLRYVNMIPFVREDGCLPLKYFLSLGEKLLELLPGQFEHFSTAFVIPVSGGKITTRIESVVRTDGSQEAILLDFDYAKLDEALHVSRIADYLDEAHEQSAALFHTLTTDSYRSYIKGEET